MSDQVDPEIGGHRNPETEIPGGQPEPTTAIANKGFVNWIRKRNWNQITDHVIKVLMVLVVLGVVGFGWNSISAHLDKVNTLGVRLDSLATREQLATVIKGVDQIDESIDGLQDLIDDDFDSLFNLIEWLHKNQPGAMDYIQMSRDRLKTIRTIRSGASSTPLFASRLVNLAGPFAAISSEDYPGHYGVYVPNLNSGTYQVFAPISGVVTSVSRMDPADVNVDRLKYEVLFLGANFDLSIKHLTSVRFSKGDFVEAGDILGTIMPASPVCLAVAAYLPQSSEPLYLPDLLLDRLISE